MMLIPMDNSQANHLKAYGVAFHCLTRGIKVEWLLNYRSGSFLANVYQDILDSCDVRGVTYEVIDGSQEADLREVIEQENMESVVLEKAPRIAIYVPPTNDPWDDAVTLVLNYAQIDYDKLSRGQVEDVPLEPGDVINVPPRKKQQSPLLQLGLFFLRRFLPF